MAGVLKYSLALRNPATLEATVLRAGDSVPDWAKDLVHADDLVDPFEDQGSDTEDEEVKPYAKWLKADLEAEVERRNTDRADDEQIVVGGTGKVADLAEALEADDEATGDTED